MTDPLLILVLSAATVGILHTAVGVDHTLPFVVLAQSRKWTLSKTLIVTLLCGLGHVLSSVAIAAVGLGFGVAGSKLSTIEQTRGVWAAWSLVALGLSYAGVALWRASSRKHQDTGGEYQHLALGLFLVFVLGPCEALLPLLTASSIALSLPGALLVTLAFSLATLGTMLTLVTGGYLGSSLAFFQKRFLALERHAHVIAGLTLAATGLSIRLFGI